MLFLIGCVAVITFILQWVALCYAWFYPKRKLSDLGPWTIITGCTDGIGKAYALHLAKANASNLFLISRSTEKLEELKKEVQATGTSKTIEVYKFDYSKPTEQSWTDLEAAVASKEVGFLINNVGLSYPSPLYYNEVSVDLLNDLLDVNVQSVFRMTRMVLKGMCDRSKGAILCLGSAAGELGSPMLGGYASAKAAVAAFCRSLQAECREYNVIVQCQTPLFVTSKMSKIKRSSLSVPTPDKFVSWSLRTLLGTTLIGILETPAVLSPYPIHAMTLDLFNRLPTMFSERYQMSHQLATYKKSMAKKAV